MSETNSTIVIDVDAYLANYDNDHALQVLPAIVWLGLLMLVGVIGNSLVCYVYIWKFKRSTARCFIVALAVYDLINCLISIAIEITDMRHRYTFGTYTLCKVGRFLVYFCSLASAAVLLAVAVDRYRKICNPLQSQLTVELSKVVIIVCSLLAFIGALPAGFIYGARTVVTDIININGSDCSFTDEYAGTIYPLIYTGFQFLIFLFATVILSVLYSLIWRQASRQQIFRNNIKTGPNPQSSKLHIFASVRDQPSVSVDTSDEILNTSAVANVAHPAGIPLEPLMTTSDRRNPLNKLHGEEGTNFNQTEESKGKSIFSFWKKSSASCQTRRHGNSADAKARVHDTFVSNTKRNKKGLRKTTFMLFLITLVFVLSYLPYLGLVAAQAVNKDVYVGLQGAELAAYNLFTRSYFINSASNPIIYSLFNESFRRKLKQLCRTITCRV